MRSRASLPSIEWPTLGLLLLVYGAWAALTLFFHHLPAWLVALLAGYVLTLHGSLQHEMVHGHPTRDRRVNGALAGGLPLAIWLPFAVYRETHLAHHRTRHLTDPYDDPESYYLDRATWDRMSLWARLPHWVMSTLAGRLLFGPVVVVTRFLAAELRRFAKGDGAHLEAWVIHLLGVTAVLAWVVGVCEISIVDYVCLFVYPGVSLTLLRSFIEHRPAPERAHRSAIVEAGPLLSLVFLFNNLHALHHREPGRPWYQLPARYRALRSELLRDNDGFYFPGYAAIALRYGLRPKDPPVHPARHSDAPC